MEVEGISYNFQQTTPSCKPRALGSMSDLTQVILTSLGLSFLTCECEGYDRPAVFKISMGEVNAKY